MKYYVIDILLIDVCTGHVVNHLKSQSTNVYKSNLSSGL